MTYSYEAGRKKAALLKGMGLLSTESSGGGLAALIDEGLVTRYRAGDSFMHKPAVGKAGRNSRTVNDLALNKDLSFG